MSWKQIRHTQATMYLLTTVIDESRLTEAAGSTKYRTEWGTASLFQGDGSDSES